MLKSTVTMIFFMAYLEPLSPHNDNFIALSDPFQMTTDTLDVHNLQDIGKYLWKILATFSMLKFRGTGPHDPCFVMSPHNPTLSFCYSFLVLTSLNGYLY